MHCSECEQLFDAYLDGQLAGSLRLEFDAHRLRCVRCQQTLTMLEAVGHVISSDPEALPAPNDFTERVMRTVARPESRVYRSPLWRAAIVAGVVVQAAAVLSLAVLWGPEAPAPAEPESPLVTVDPEIPLDPEAPGYQAVHSLIVERIEDRLYEMRHVGLRLTSDLIRLAGYADIVLPDIVARESEKMVGVSPFQAFFDGILPAEEDEPEPVAPSDDVHSI